MDRSATKRRGRGGKRPGAGRPAGSKNTLPLGAVSAIKALRHRVPDGTPKDLREVADEALGTVAAIMRGEFYDAQAASTRLRAAAMAREEICGPIAQKVQHAGHDGGPVVFEFPPIPGDEEP